MECYMTREVMLLPYLMIRQLLGNTIQFSNALPPKDSCLWYRPLSVGVSSRIKVRHDGVRVHLACLPLRDNECGVSFGVQ